jgi:glycine hydroxymethyltransferase
MVDKQVMSLILEEEKRQQKSLQMIASENYVSKAVREAVGSVLMNKYSEGYAGKRYYQGNAFIDEMEMLAVERAKQLFGVVHVNVQPYSGSPANAAVLMGLLEPGDKVMGLKLSGGGHLTHGHPKITFSGKFYNSVQYDVNEGGLIDYDVVEKLAKEEKPKLMIIGTTAYPRTLDFARFAKIADSVGAWVMADISHIAGLVAAGVHPSPVEFADVVTTTTHKTLRGPRGAMIMVTEKGLEKDSEITKKIDKAVFPGLQGGPHNNTTAGIAVALGEDLKPEFKKYALDVVKNAKALSEELMRQGYELTTGGTDNHLMVVDLRKQGVGGKDVAVALEKAGIVVNYNTVPHDTNPPANPSGIRLGTPALTTRGMGEVEMRKIAVWMDVAIKNVGNEEKLGQVACEVEKMCDSFPFD